MANVNIFDKYGIKEVANVYFEALEDELDKKIYKGDIVLYLDSLKVSTIETTGETTAATGGYGNTKWIQWDYGKEINITLEDALMSFESLRFMMGGSLKSSMEATAEKPILVHRTLEFVMDSNDKTPTAFEGGAEPKAIKGHPMRLINLTQGYRTQIEANGDTAVTLANKTLTFTNPSMIPNATATPNHQAAAKDGDHIRVFWVEEQQGSGSSAVEISISPDTFPGTYKVIGDTLIRNKNGKDEPFQFVINKAKVQSNVTLTLQAEGDPTTFEMTLNVLRSTNEDGQPEMMKLIRYGTDDGPSTSGDDIGSVG